MDRDHDVLIVDGYVDEPSTLGVPPYIAPQVRMLAGCLEELELDWDYITVDEYRREGLSKANKILVYGGVTVPGNYLRGRPISEREANEIGRAGEETFIAGPLAKYGNVENFDHVVKKDLPVYFYNHLSGREEERWTNRKEMERWLKKGSVVVKKHPDFPDPLIVEISLYRGCVRYFTGGCSFCSEPHYGKPRFRKQKDIVTEIKELYEKGVRKFRIGGQSCTISYMAEGIGDTETPRPQPREVKKLFEGIWKNCPDIEVLHLDNANPSVVSNWPDESERVLRILVENTTPGNVLALGMESSDPRVIEENNLNSNPDEVYMAMELINKVGRKRGENGMPKLLPGLNFLAGLKKESSQTYKKNLSFLEKVLKNDILVRRINIRQVLSHTEDFEMNHKDDFKKFKENVRKKIDRPMLRKIIPRGTVLKDVYMEKRDGNKTFGRQIGTYPLLVGIEYPVELGKYKNIVVTDHGFRSVTGLAHPFKLGNASYEELKAVPGLGERRAAKIFREQPDSWEEASEIIDDKVTLEKLKKYAEI